MISKKEFKLIFETYHKDLQGFDYTFTESVSDYEEIVQDIFISL